MRHILITHPSHTNPSSSLPFWIGMLMLFCVAALMTGCVSDTNLSRLPEGMEDALDDADIDENNPTFEDLVKLSDILDEFGNEPIEDDPENEDEENDDDPLDPGEICSNSFSVWDGFAYNGDWTEVSAFPNISFVSGPGYDITQGDDSSLAIAINAMCGPISLNHTFAVVDQEIGAGWNTGPYENETEMTLRDPIENTDFGSGPSPTLSYVPGGDELHFLASAPDTNVMGSTILIDPIVIDEGETLILQFHLPGEFSEFVPTEESFGISLNIFGWTDLSTDTTIRLGTIYPWGLPAGGLEDQGGDEMLAMGPGTVYTMTE